MIEGIRYRTVFIYFVCLFLALGLAKSQNNFKVRFSTLSQDSIKKPIYTKDLKKHGSLYKWAWGVHYQNLYYKPVTTKSLSVSSLFSELSVIDTLSQLHAFILNNKENDFLLLKPLGGYSSFLESNFFSSVYRKEDLKDTYLGDFINEAYTIVHPYMFLVSEYLANRAGLSFENSDILYLTKNDETDSIRELNGIGNKFVSMSPLPDMKRSGVIENTDTLLERLHNDNLSKIDQPAYIKARLFDMLIGDWNKIPENWYWVPSYMGDSIIYTPQALDRSHAFTKVDGFLFKELLNMLGVGFITNYEDQLRKVKTFNDLSFTLDMALTQNTTVSMWQEQARLLKNELTEDIIDAAFLKLPKEMQNREADILKKNLRSRKRNLEELAINYYILMQKTPVITGTNGDDRIVIEQDNKDVRIRIYDKKTSAILFDRKYRDKYTKEIWIYSLGGNDSFEVDKEKKNIKLLLIGANGINNYTITHGNNVSIYESKTEKERLKSLTRAKLVIPNNDRAMDYDYQRLYYTSISFTPIGIYDSDLGLNLGTSAAYTIYGFKRAPYSLRHQISYDLNNGFTYQGIFPSFDEKKSIHIAALIGSPAYFSNFFGFGNNTDGYKTENRNYNRVNINKYMLAPAFYYNIDKKHVLNICVSFEAYKVKDKRDRDRLINEVYTDEHSIFSRKYFIDFSTTYQINKELKQTLSSFQFLLTPGWTMNITNPQRNFGYVKANLGVNLKLTDRITFATLLKGKIIFSDNYEFFQGATTELRGFRDNRFIGQQSFYQYSDIRLDMGKLHNPLTPLHYGIFVGTDYGRVWYPQEDSRKWHLSYGGGFWLTLLRKYTGKFSYFGSSDGARFKFELGMGF